MRILQNRFSAKLTLIIIALSIFFAFVTVIRWKSFDFTEQHILINKAVSRKLSCTFVFENYTAYCNFPISQFYQSHLIDDLEIMKNSSIIKLIKFKNGHEINQGCSFTTKCLEQAHFNEIHNKTFNFPPCCRRNTILMFKEMITLLETYDFNYSLSAGSVLGLVRHHGQMIPYDDDIDIIVPLEKRQIFNDEIVPILKKNGHHVHNVSGNEMQTHVELSKKNLKTVDLFWYIIKDGFVIVKDYSGLKYKSSLFFPTKQALFEQVLVRIPAYSLDYVKYRYGKSWNILRTCRQKYGHNC
ncbi:hypothetical protein GJ496_009960 [Pomphorhynchus laevis]|nr:hypothetical protein GJ496_009960 [Pomphorhynchus laevis]